MPRPDWKPATFRTLPELKGELDRVERAHRDGTLRTTGNWGPGQIIDHCAINVRKSLDGFDGIVAPVHIRLAGRLVFRPLLGRSQMRPGIKLPASAASMLPRDDVAFDEAMADLRAQIARLDAGERMTAVSPVMGRLSHDQWTELHLNHCRLHFGFFRFDG